MLAAASASAVAAIRWKGVRAFDERNPGEAAAPPGPSRSPVSSELSAYWPRSPRSTGGGGGGGGGGAGQALVARITDPSGQVCVAGPAAEAAAAAEEAAAAAASRAPKL